MAHPTPRHWAIRRHWAIKRHWAAATVVAAALLALGACGSKPSTDAADPGGNPQFGGAVSGSADPSANPSASTDNGGGGGGGTGGGGGGGGTTTAPVDRYPKDAKTYMQQFLIALGNADKVRIAELAQDNPILIATNANTAYGKLNTQWSSNNCASTNCLWRNTHGDEASVSIEPEKLGLPNAVYYLSLDITNLSNNPYEYVTGFLGSIGSGNKPRGVFMGSDALWSQFASYQMFPNTSQITDMGGGYTKVEIFQPNRQDEHYVAFKILSQPGGKANAIKAGCTQLAGCNL